MNLIFFRMSVVRQVPRVLRKDYASMRWWKDQQPLETQDKSVASVSFIYFYLSEIITSILVPWWFLGSYDPPMVLHWTKTLDELPI